MGVSAAKWCKPAALQGEEGSSEVSADAHLHHNQVDVSRYVPAAAQGKVAAAAAAAKKNGRFAAAAS
jgi:hypothetical protein